MINISVLPVSALTKILPDRTPPRLDGILSGLSGQNVSFQLAIDFGRASSPLKHLTAKITTDAPELSAYKVELVPVSVPAFDLDEDGYLADFPSLLPDRLSVIDKTGEADACEFALTRTHIGWHGFWFDVKLPTSHIAVEVFAEDESVASFDLPVLAVEQALPPLELVNTRWFHVDTLADVLRVEVWSEEHWAAIEAHLASAARMGINSVLTPLWSPPLDTAVGSYRTASQLLSIAEVEPGVYEFGTERADRWIEAMRRCGISTLEVPHLFTQWGANFCPAFWITRDGKLERRFGWETAATDAEYQNFLGQLLPFLRQYLETKLGQTNVWFHISDEPSAEQLDSYRAARAVALPLLEGAQIMDALSAPAYNGLVANPVVAVDAVQGFRDIGVEPAWVYYCVSQNHNVANQFIAQSGVRHRLLGLQLYKNAARGFLHWAYNFYYSQYSKALIDPYQDTAAGGGFISGDSFIVYPKPNGDLDESIRHRMLGDGFRDLATCQLAEKLISRQTVLKIIDPDGDLDYSSGWISEDELLRRVEQLHQAIAKAVS